MKSLYIIFFSISSIFLLIRLKNKNKKFNKKLLNFKTKLVSQQSSIEKIYSRNDERTASDPNINIHIGIYDKESTIALKANIHRARLAKFKKSKLNGEMIFKDSNEKIFKLVKGKKLFIN